MPDPIPRPTRFFFSVDFLGARIVDKFIKSLCRDAVSRIFIHNRDAASRVSTKLFR